MMIDEHHARMKEDRMRQQKEIKVKIPLDYHVRLHTTKVVEGQSISETVQAALAKYFATMNADGSAQPVVAGAQGVVEERAPTRVAATLPRP